MLKINLKNISPKLTDRELIKKTALALKNKYDFYVLYKFYNNSTKDYILWIAFEESIQNFDEIFDKHDDYIDSINLLDNLKTLEKNFFESFSIEDSPKVTYKEILKYIIAKEDLNPEASKIEYRKFKVFDKNTKTWIKKQ